MTSCHSRIERPYFFSIEGKYEDGPCLGHGRASLTVAPLLAETPDPYHECRGSR